MSEHTPGPWRFLTDYAYRGFQSRILVVVDGKGAAVARIPAEPIMEEDAARVDALRLANARLMAAAPDLLAACEAVSANPVVTGLSAHLRDRAESDLDSDPLALARAAIAKAKGEPK